MSKYNSRIYTSSHTRYYSEDSTKKSKLKRLPHLNEKSLDLTEVSEDKTKYLHLLKDIDKLCDSYNQLPLIEFEDEEPIQTANSISETVSQQPVTDAKLNFIINQLKLRIKSYPKAQAVYPSTNRFKVVSGTEEKVGPGTYKSSNTDQLESYEFSNIPRLHTPITHTMQIIQSLYKKKSEMTEDAIIKKNKLLAKNPKQVREELDLKILQFKSKEKKAKLKKESLDIQQHVEKTYKLKEKIRKFEWRMSKEEVAVAQKTWAIFVTCVGSLTVLQLRAKVRRILRIRWGKILRKFCLIVRCVGRILVRLRKIRKRIVNRTLKALSLPLTTYFYDEVLGKKKVVQWIVDKVRDMPMFIHLMAKWKSQIIMITRNLRGVKKVDKARRYAVGLLWDKLSESIQKIKMQEKIHRSLTIDRVFILPKLIKNKFIKKFLKEVISEHMKEMRHYAQVLKYIKAQAASEKPNPVPAVVKPVLNIYSRKALLSNYIELASTYNTRLEKRQREIKYNLVQPKELNHSQTKKY